MRLATGTIIKLRLEPAMGNPILLARINWGQHVPNAKQGNRTYCYMYRRTGRSTIAPWDVHTVPVREAVSTILELVGSGKLSGPGLPSRP